MPDTDTELDMGARYSVSGYGRVAFYLLGYATEWTEESWTWIEDEEDREDDNPENERNYWYDEPDEIEDRGRVRAVMVGDDYVHTVDVDDLTPIDDLDYCAECGQIGCTADGRDREEG